MIFAISKSKSSQQKHIGHRLQHLLQSRNLYVTPLHHHHTYIHISYIIYTYNNIVVCACVCCLMFVVQCLQCANSFLSFSPSLSPTTTSSDESLLEISTTCRLYIDNLSANRVGRKLQNLMKNFTELDGFCCHIGFGHFTTILVYQYDIVSLYQYESKNVLPMYQYANTTFVWKKNYTKR